MLAYNIADYPPTPALPEVRSIVHNDLARKADQVRLKAVRYRRSITFERAVVPIRRVLFVAIFRRVDQHRPSPRATWRPDITIAAF